MKKGYLIGLPLQTKQAAESSISGPSSSCALGASIVAKSPRYPKAP